MYYTRFNTEFCEIILAGDESGLKHLHLNTGKGKRKFTIDEKWAANADFFSETVRQIEEYFRGKRRIFSIKLNPEGSDYQKKIWKEVMKVSFGETAAYGEIAERTGNKKSARAVGSANSKNPIPLIIPCHRITGAKGDLTGYAHGLELKKKLLDFEAENPPAGSFRQEKGKGKKL